MASLRLLWSLTIAFTLYIGYSTGTVPMRNAELIVVGSTDSKIYYTSSDSGNLTWLRAQEFCYQAAVGMKLAEFHGNEDEQIALNYLAAQDSQVVIQFWLSATDFGSESVFHWTKSGAPLEKEVLQSGWRDANCLKVQFNGLYFDEFCSTFSNNLLWPLCEIEGSFQGTSTEGVPEPTSSLPSTTSATTVAPFICSSEGSHADPNDCTIFHVCVEYQGGYIDYELSCPANTNYCEKDQICGHPEECPCEAQTRKRDKEKDYVSENQHMNTVSSSLGPKDDTLILVGSVGSKTFYTAERGDTNWIDSMEFCHKNEMMLARMETDEERSLFLNYLSLSYYTNYFWLSGVDYGSEGNYYWINNGTAVGRDVYGNNGKENCLYLADVGPLYSWDCEYNKYYTMWPLCQA